LVVLELVVLFYFNNESAFGENNSQFRDWSPDVNSQKTKVNNGTCTNCPVYNSTEVILGRSGITFTADSITFTSTPLGFNNTISIWTKIEHQAGVASGNLYTHSLASGAFPQLGLHYNRSSGKSNIFCVNIFNILPWQRKI
jgi:hypothetical protein